MLGVVAGATVLAMAGPAFACTTYYGKTTVSDTETVAGVPNQAWADGSTAIHGYCPGGGVRQNPAYTADPGDPHYVLSDMGIMSEAYQQPSAEATVRQPIDLTGDFTVTVGQTTTCTATQGSENSLNDIAGGNRDYEVRWLPVSATDATNLEAKGILPLMSCNFGVTGPWTVLESAFTVSGGTGSVDNVSVPGGNHVGPVNICVTSPDDDGQRPAAPEVWLQVI